MTVEETRDTNDALWALMAEAEEAHTTAIRHQYKPQESCHGKRVCRKLAVCLRWKLPTPEMTSHSCKSSRLQSRPFPLYFGSQQ